MNRTLYINSPCHLRVKQGQLVVERNEGSNTVNAPIEDIAHVILENRQITLTMSVLQELGNANANLIVCNTDFLPAHMMLTLTGNTLAQERFRSQINSSRSLHKQLWQYTIKCKVKNQAASLSYSGFDDKALKYLSGKVLLDDKTGIESRAARIYWGTMFGNDFIRRRMGAPPNNLLNFGYTILRSAIARALSASGLLPMLGIHHHNRYNHFCLADDIMEPYRPIIDILAYRIYSEEYMGEEITIDIKSRFINMLDSDITMNGQQCLLRNAIDQTAISLVRSFESNKVLLEYPDLYE